jgi:hypothetical protein
MNTYFRVHPNINFSRVGSSEEYYLAPETAAGEVIDTASGLFGGLPIKKGTENTVIDDSDFRDSNSNPVRQAARFRIYSYDQAQSSYPSEDPGKEIKIGDTVGGKTIADIVWQVHLANKKANNYQITGVNSEGVMGEYGIESYEGTIPLPPIRNADFAGGLDDPTRLKQLVIDAGPRTLKASSNGERTLEFNAATPPSYNVNGTIQQQDNYPVSFPSDYFDLLQPLGVIDTLGQMTIEANTGRLIVAGGYGKASGIKKDGVPPNLCDAIDNDDWFDDTSDGPVTATIVFTDGSTADAAHGWVVCTDPSYAPQTRNVVSTWDDMYSAWVEDKALNLVPSMYSNGVYNDSYKAAFDQDVLPVFHGAFLQRWNTNLPQKAIIGHEYMASVKPSDDPTTKIRNFPNLIRDPSDESDVGGKMPLALGDAQKSFLSVSATQYFLLMQWYAGASIAQGAPLGGGEKLDRAVLENCLGGRYSPGIDLTFIVRDKNLFVQQWQGVIGPFRINKATLDYATASKDSAFLNVGYVPLQSTPVQPGDLCKFMSQPWHTDYNSCATHTPDPNPQGNNTLYWSWPAQRPVNVHPAAKCTYDATKKTWSLGGQVYSIRGDDGTHTDYPQQQGRYQCYYDYVQNWHKVGFVIQGSQIADSNGGNYGSDKFLEVASLYTSDGDMVSPWPQASRPGYQAPTDCGPPDSPACPID